MARAFRFPAKLFKNIRFSEKDETVHFDDLLEREDQLTRQQR